MACMLCSLCFTACDPDDVDAFAEGYRYGYESQQDDDDDDWKGINQNENSDIENVK